MAYSEFTLERVKREFNLTTFEKSDIFADVSELEGSTWLTETLKYYQPIVPTRMKLPLQTPRIKRIPQPISQ